MTGRGSESILRSMAKRQQERGRADASKDAAKPQGGRSEGDVLTEEEVHQRARAIARGLFRRNLELVGRKP